MSLCLHPGPPHPGHAVHCVLPHGRASVCQHDGHLGGVGSGQGEELVQDVVDAQGGVCVGGAGGSLVAASVSSRVSYCPSRIAELVPVEKVTAPTWTTSGSIWKLSMMETTNSRPVWKLPLEMLLEPSMTNMSSTLSWRQGGSAAWFPPRT